MGCTGSKETEPVAHLTTTTSRQASPGTSQQKPSLLAKPQPADLNNPNTSAPSSPLGSTPEDVLRISGALPLESNPAGLTRQGSPDEVRMAQSAINKNKQAGILTVCEKEEDHSSQTHNGHMRHSAARVNGCWASKAGGDDTNLPGSCDASDRSSGNDLNRQHSTMALSPAGVTTPSGAVGNGAPSLEDSLLLLDPATHKSPPKPRYPQPSEMVLDLLDDDDDDDEDEDDGAVAGFSMQRWKRHFTWNKTKHKDLLTFLWKRFDKASWTMYCITWKQQDALLDAYQGENIIHGLSCRLETLMSSAKPVGQAANGGTGAAGSSLSDQLFGVLLTLVEKEGAGHKVVGVLLARGTGASPSCLHDLQELKTDWQVQAADVSDPLVRTFVSNLITSQPPSPHYAVAARREIL